MIPYNERLKLAEALREGLAMFTEGNVTEVRAGVLTRPEDPEAEIEILILWKPAPSGEADDIGALMARCYWPERRISWDLADPEWADRHGEELINFDLWVEIANFGDGQRELFIN